MMNRPGIAEANDTATACQPGKVSMMVVPSARFGKPLRIATQRAANSMQNISAMTGSRPANIMSPIETPRMA